MKWRNEFGLPPFAPLCPFQYLGSTVAFTALTSVSTIGLYIAYGLPILMKLTLGRKRFQAGPFNLGRFRLEWFRFCGCAPLWCSLSFVSASRTDI